MKLAPVLTILMALVVPGAASEDFYRWQSSEYAATQRFIQLGIATPGVNEIYAAKASQFVQTRDVLMGAVCPDQYTTGTHTSPSWLFFGARFLPLPATSGEPSFYGLSYVGSAVAFHGGLAFDAVITPGQIGSAAPEGLCVQELGAADTQIAANGFAHFNRLNHFAPLSWNSEDIDGDGKGDFTLGGLLYVSSNGFSAPIGTARLGAEAVFIRTDLGPRLVRVHQGTLYMEKYQSGALVVEASRAAGFVPNAGHSITVLPGRTAGTDSVAFRLSCGLQPLRYEGGVFSWPSPCIGGLSPAWAMPGARGDFDGDGVDDFWISQTFLGSDPTLEQDHVSLVSGAAYLAAPSGSIALSSITIARIDGSSDFTDHDGIATTLSPIAGDIDGDGIPDLTFSGHRHMNEAGAMYILLGKDLTPGFRTDLTDPKIIKVVGELMSQLAPPYHHWDATDWDGDGYDDIVVTADNDMRAGLNAGAVYLLSGASILNTRPSFSPSP